LRSANFGIVVSVLLRAGFVLHIFSQENSQQALVQMMQLQLGIRKEFISADA